MIVLAAPAAHAQDKSNPLLVVVATGKVSGFADARDLTRYLADQMNAAGTTWHFAAPSAVAETLPQDRVEWKFKTLKVVWGGGAHKGFPQPVVTRSYLSAEVRLYLHNQYQTTMLAQPTVVSGDRSELAEMVAKVTHLLAAAADTDKS
jgi:hypothetical protein